MHLFLAALNRRGWNAKLVSLGDEIGRFTPQSFKDVEVNLQSFDCRVRLWMPI